jgi:membrane-bound metal-dependent hydrolase YbcI (DUF457 family)
MADFKTHITVSTSLGVAYGTAAYFLFDVPPTTCIVAGGLCSISGMLPDLDSDSGVPVREMISLLGAVIPMLMIDRFRHFGWSPEGMACAAIVIYCIVRFGAAEIFKRYTVHRGMWHSIPACLTATLLAFLIVSGEDFFARAFKSLAVCLGFMSHLVLDEIWSFQVGLGGVRVKKSFGTALKFYSKSMWANLSAYAKLIVVALLAFGDPVMMERFDLGDHHAPQVTREFFNRVLGRIEQARHKLEEGQGWRLVPRDQPTPSFDDRPLQEVPGEPNVLPASGVEPLPVDVSRSADSTSPLPMPPRY